VYVNNNAKEINPIFPLCRLKINHMTWCKLFTYSWPGCSGEWHWLVHPLLIKHTWSWSPFTHTLTPTPSSHTQTCIYSDISTCLQRSFFSNIRASSDLSLVSQFPPVSWAPHSPK
jgi:hypothetical protein